MTERCKQYIYMDISSEMCQRARLSRCHYVTVELHAGRRCQLLMPHLLIDRVTTDSFVAVSFSHGRKICHMGQSRLSLHLDTTIAMSIVWFNTYWWIKLVNGLKRALGYPYLRKLSIIGILIEQIHPTRAVLDIYVEVVSTVVHQSDEK